MTRSRADSSGSGDRPESVDLETALELLADERRRRVLLTLRECDSHVSLDELALRVASRTQESTFGVVSQRLIDRVKISLYHTHLPKLHDANVVEYDVARETVALTMESGYLEELLDAVRFVQR